MNRLPAPPFDLTIFLKYYFFANCAFFEKYFLSYVKVKRWGDEEKHERLRLDQGKGWLHRK